MNALALARVSVGERKTLIRSLSLNTLSQCPSRSSPLGFSATFSSIPVSGRLPMTKHLTRNNATCFCLSERNRHTDGSLFLLEKMLNGTVEPLLTMTSSESNIQSNQSASKRSKMKASSLGANASMTSQHSTINNDNRIKFIDMLVCGSCQQDFQLSDIVKFIEHKAKCGNKENKRKIPYFLSHRRPREGDNDDEDDDDDEDEESHHEDNTSGSETENQIHLPAHQRNSSQKQSELSKTLIDASANTSNSTSNSPFSICQTRRHLFLIRLAEPYNFQCSQCGDVYSTGNDRSDE